MPKLQTICCMILDFEKNGQTYMRQVVNSRHYTPQGQSIGKHGIALSNILVENANVTKKKARWYHVVILFLMVSFFPFLSERCSGFECHCFYVIIISFYHYHCYYYRDDYVHYHSFRTTDLGFLKLGISGSANAHVLGCSCPWTVV